jgi:N-acetylneuraminate synthase
MSVFTIAEISANHLGSKERAIELIRLAASSGASAVKFQHFRPDTITMKSDHPDFQVSGGTMWDGRILADLYAEAMTPWEWTGDLVREADKCGIQWLSSPFDASAVDFLEEFRIPMYKIASFEVVDLPLISYVASKRKPMIISTGMASELEISSAIETARGSGAPQISILRCNSSYPAPVDEMDLAAIPRMIEEWQIPVGLSDHTIGSTSAVVAVALGASVIEKHLTIRRTDGGPDSSFSSEPGEFAQLVRDVDAAARSIGKIRFGPSKSEAASMRFRRSLRVAQSIRAGEILRLDHVRSVRPAGGLSPKEFDNVIGRAVLRDLRVGDPLTADCVDWQ